MCHHIVTTQVNWSAKHSPFSTNQKNHPKSEVVKHRCWHQRPPAPWGYWNAASEGNSWRCMVGKSPKTLRKSAFSWWSDSVKMDDHCNNCVHILFNYSIYAGRLVMFLLTTSSCDLFWAHQSVTLTVRIMCKQPVWLKRFRGNAASLCGIAFKQCFPRPPRPSAVTLAWAIMKWWTRRVSWAPQTSHRGIKWIKWKGATPMSQDFTSPSVRVTLHRLPWTCSPLRCLTTTYDREFLGPGSHLISSKGHYRFEASSNPHLRAGAWIFKEAKCLKYPEILHNPTQFSPGQIAPISFTSNPFQ